MALDKYSQEKDNEIMKKKKEGFFVGYMNQPLPARDCCEALSNAERFGLINYAGMEKNEFGEGGYFLGISDNGKPVRSHSYIYLNYCPFCGRAL